MNPLLNFLEKQFTIFALIFLTDILRFSSLFMDPDPKADAVNTYNPFDSLMSPLQHGIYVATLVLLIARGKSSVITTLRNPLIWLLPVTATMSFLWSDFSSWSLQKGIATLQTTYFGVYMASRYTLKQQLLMLAWALGIVTVFSVLFTLAFSGAAIEAGANAGAWRGPFTQKNILARIAVLAAIVFLLLALDSRKHRCLFWGGFSLSIFLILMTGSKTALLLFLMLVMLLPLYKALRWQDTKVIPLIIILILVTASIAVFVTSNWESLLLSLGRDPSLSGRTSLWELALEKISARPWLGYGYQGFWQDGGGAEIIWKHEGYKPPHSHNGFINITLDLGLVGLFLFLLTIVVNYVRSIVWLKMGKTTIELWPIFYITFFFMYNHSENTILAHNSIFWSLLVAVSLSMKRMRAVPSKSQKKSLKQSFQGNL